VKIAINIHQLEEKKKETLFHGDIYILAKEVNMGLNLNLNHLFILGQVAKYHSLSIP
jgi:hypothetical protein